VAVRITKQGLEAIAVEDAAVAAPEEAPICAAAAPKVETSATEAIASRKRISVAAQKPRKKHQPGKAKHRFASDCVVDDAVSCEPISAPNSLL